MPSSDSHDYALIDQLAEEFAERFRKGERPSIQEYCDRYPYIADDLREMLPALAEVEHIKDEVQETPAVEMPKLRQVGEYSILREVGRGGMGVVYEAEQVTLGRRVALKVLAGGKSGHGLERFKREARAAARLHHTNIVPVFGVGDHEGMPYYVMQFIQGLGIDEVLDGVKRLQAVSGTAVPPSAISARPPRKDVSAAAVARSLVTGIFEPPPINDIAETLTHAPVGQAASLPGQREQAGSLLRDTPTSASSISLPGQSNVSGRKQSYWHSVAQIGLQVADALEYAHKQGILHRDIKPSNLLLDLHGVVWVTDFGLAKTDDQENLTHTGDVLGTLRYMPPEAFEGKSSVQTDVYSLGLTIYELLALRPAFDERDRGKLVKQVTTSEPARLDRMNRAIPRDLATIIHKAIEKAPSHRYESAADFAADLQRFVDDEPIRARRLGIVERGWRSCRRHPGVASLTAVLTLLLLGVTVASLFTARHFENTASNERTARQQADDARRTTVLTLADSYTSFGLAAGTRDDPRQAVQWFAHAARLAGDDRERADANRTRAAAWGRQAIQPVRAFVHPAEWVENNMTFHPGGWHLLTHGYDTPAYETSSRLWDVEQEAALPFPGNVGVVSAAAWDAEGKRLAVGTTHGEVAICRFPGGELLQRVPFAGRIVRVHFSPDGRYLAVAAAGRVRVWDCQRSSFATPELTHPALVVTLAFHPKGELLATGCRDYMCRVFAVPEENGTPLFPPVPHSRIGWASDGMTPIAPRFLDEGQELLTVSRDEATWRDSRTGRVLRGLSLGEPGVETLATAIALSGDGKHLVLAGGYSRRPNVRICEVASAQPVSPNLNRRAMQPTLATAFSPDGLMLATGGGDRAARLWSVPEGKPLSGPLTHPTTVSSVALAPDGRHLATAQRGGLIRLWALPAGNSRDHRVPVGAESLVRLSRDGRFLLPTGLNRNSCELRNTQVFDLTTGQRIGPPLEADGFILDAAFAPDGLQVAACVSCATSPQERGTQWQRTSLQPGRLLLWDRRSGARQQEPLPSEPRALDYSPDGRHLAVVCAQGELVVMDPATGKTLRQWQARPPFLTNGAYINNGAVRFCPDNRWLLTFGTPTNPGEHSVRVWDALTGQLQHELMHEGKCHDVQFSPDGRLVATASYDNRACVWALATGERLASLVHPDWPFTAHFSPDGKHLLTGCRDGMARLWDWRAGRLVCPPFEHEHEVHAVAFTPDGRHVLSASDDGVLKIWEWRTGKPVCPPLALGGAGLSLAVTPDGGRVAVGGFMKELSIFHLEDWLAPATLEPDDLCLWGEILSGQRIEDGGGVTNLTTEEWLERWKRFRREHPGHGLPLKP